MANSNETDTVDANVHLSKHATIRCQQRGIQKIVVDLLHQFGKRDVRPGNAIMLTLSSAKRNSLIAELKKYIHVFEQTKNTAVLVANDSEEEVITVYHRHGQ